MTNASAPSSAATTDASLPSNAASGVSAPATVGEPNPAAVGLPSATAANDAPASNSAKTPATPKHPRSARPGHRPQRPVLYISARKPAGLLMYARRIPEDILAMDIYPSKTTTIRLALGTRDWLQAQPKATQLSATIEQIWAQARHRQAATTAAVAPSNPRQLRRDDIPVLRQRLESLLLHCDDVDRDKCLTDPEFDQYLEEFKEQQERLCRASVRSDGSAVEDETLGLLEAEGLDCDPQSPEWPLMLKAVLQAHLAALNAIAERLDGQVRATPAPPPFIRCEGDLDDLDQALLHWKRKCSPEPKTVIEMQAALERFTSTTNRTRVSSIQPDDIVHFLNVERVRDSARGGKVNVQTVNKGVALLKALFAVVHTDFLKNYGINNPFADVRKFKVKARDRGHRKVFSEEQLATLFSGPIHVSQYRPEGGAGEAAYWVPILGYVTGARMQELLQARVKDVVEVDGVLMLQTETCSDGDGDGDGEDEVDEDGAAGQAAPRMSLKTNESYRFIPIHRDVLALGFREYVEWVKAAGHLQLFPDVRIGVNESWSANFSKFFNRYLKRMEVKARLLDFVSFRHQFKTQTRTLRIEQDIADYIQGHAQKRASQGYGEFPAKTLKESIETMAFPALAHCAKWSAPTRPVVRRTVATPAPKKG